MSNLSPLTGFFIYPSEPPLLAQTISETVRHLQNHSSERAYKSWEGLNVGGQIIFCEICKAFRSSKAIIANITTLNFNVLFELGYALGLGKPVLPVRDTSYERDKELFDELGIFDNLGYEDFKNSSDLVRIVLKKEFSTPFRSIQPQINRQQPIYYLRSPIENDGSVKIFSCLKKSYFRFRSFDSRETARLSLHDAYREALSSIAVVGHLLDPERKGAKVHNARVAFVCGMAMAAQRHVLILQEGSAAQPIDYRDVVVPYEDISTIPPVIESLVRATAETIQSDAYANATTPIGVLERVNLGDVAAENEIQALSRYFVKTPQFQQAKLGQARLIVGRKGSGKSAIFYGVRHHLKNDRHNLVLDLKPEGHQFTKFRETVLKNLSEGRQLHTLTAFWNYLLLLELTKKLLDRDADKAWRNPDAVAAYKELKQMYDDHVPDDEGDFSERVMLLVEKNINSFSLLKDESKTKDVTSLIYQKDIQTLNAAVSKYLNSNEVIWLLFDNLDKGWPARGAQPEDIAILRCLLEATRKLQRSLERQHVDFKTIVFIRKDVYDLFVDQTPDRGKESVANLDWSDIELIKELLLRRFRAAETFKGDFEEIWARLFDAHVKGENSFTYILSRTFLRPRDVLNFVRKSIQIAVSRGRSRVGEDDILNAEIGFSEDMLNDLRYEIRDMFPNNPEIVNKFMRQTTAFSHDDLWLLLSEAGIPEEKVDEVLDVLLWFSFLGVIYQQEENYTYQMLYNLPKLKNLINENKSFTNFIVHPAFRTSLKSV